MRKLLVMFVIVVVMALAIPQFASAAPKPAVSETLVYTFADLNGETGYQQFTADQVFWGLRVYLNNREYPIVTTPFTCEPDRTVVTLEVPADGWYVAYILMDGKMRKGSPTFTIPNNTARVMVALRPIQ